MDEMDGGGWRKNMDEKVKKVELKGKGGEDGGD